MFYFHLLWLLLQQIAISIISLLQNTFPYPNLTETITFIIKLIIRTNFTICLLLLLSYHIFESYKLLITNDQKNLHNEFISHNVINILLAIISIVVKMILSWLKETTKLKKLVQYRWEHLLVLHVKGKKSQVINICLKHITKIISWEKWL